MKLNQRLHTRYRRRAFTFVIVPLILAVTMVALGVIYALQHQQPIVPNAPRQPALKVLSGVTLFAGWLVVMASPWAEKKGHKSASIVFGAILLLGNLAMLNAVTGWSAKMRAKNQGITATPMAPPTYAKGAPPSSDPAPTPTPFPTIDPSSSVPEPSPFTPPDSLPPAETPTETPSAPPTTRPRTERPVRPAPRITQEPSVDLDPIVNQLRDSLNAELAARMTDAAAIYKILEKPRHDRKQLDDQIATLKELQKKLIDSATRIRSIDTEFADLAEKVGASRAFSMPRAFEFAREVNSFERAVACDRIARACDSGTDLLALLRDNISKWTYNSKGEITTKDKTLEHKLFGPKSRVGFALKDKDDLISRLKP